MKIWERIKIAFCCRSKCSLNELVNEVSIDEELQPQFDYYSGKQKKYLSSV